MRRHHWRYRRAGRFDGNPQALGEHLVGVSHLPFSQVEHFFQPQDILMWLEARFGRDTQTLPRQECPKLWTQTVRTLPFT